jgi:hypothetical protein
VNGVVTGTRILNAGSHSIGRSPHCTIILPQLEAEVLAQLTLSASGSIAILPFVSDLTLNESVLMLGAAVEAGTIANLDHGTFRIVVRRASPEPQQQSEIPASHAEGGRIPLRLLGSRQGSAPHRITIVATLLLSAGTVLALAAVQFGRPVAVAAGSTMRGKIAPDAAQRFEIALASADIVSPVRVGLENDRLVLTGEVTEAEMTRLVALARAAGDAQSIDLQVTPKGSDIGSRVAGVSISPAPAVLGVDGLIYREGSTFHDWSLVAIGPEGVRLTRGDRATILPLPGREKDR